MQKKIIALAVAGLASTAAFAQTNVTVYGVVDLGEAYVAASGTGSSHASVLRLDSNSTYLGFKGVEDLGNGLKALFQLETGYSPDSGAGFGASRDSFVGLTGGFGTVVAGTLTHPLRAMGAKVELMPGATGLGLSMATTGKILGMNTGADERANNAIAYVSPSFSGFSATVAYINGHNAGATGTIQETRSVTAGAVAQPRAYQLAAQYDNGPLFVGAGYHRVVEAGTSGAAFPVAGNGESTYVARAAAVYTFPSATKLTALVDKTSADMTTNTGHANRLAYSLGVSQGFGKNTVGLAYGHSNRVKTNGVTVANSSSSIVSAIYTYDLSKRTMIHARLSRLSNGDGINTNFYINPVANGLTTANGTDYTGAMVGLRHVF